MRILNLIRSTAMPGMIKDIPLTQPVKKLAMERFWTAQDLMTRKTSKVLVVTWPLKIISTPQS
jgi:hypothetical protein